MKYADYATAPTVEQGEALRSLLRKDAASDSDLYSIYIDVAPEYNDPLQKRRGWCNLQAAIRRGKVQVVVIQSMENLYVSEARGYFMLKRLMERGVQIAHKHPRNTLTEDSLMKLATESQLEYFVKNLAVPLITMDDCLVHDGFSSGFICLGTDPSVHPYFSGRHKTMSFPDAVQEYKDNGFFLYRPDKNGWYHVDPVFAGVMYDFFLENFLPF